MNGVRAIAYVMGHLSPDEQRQLDAAMGAGWKANKAAKVVTKLSRRTYLVHADGRPCFATGIYKATNGRWEVWAAMTQAGSAPINRDRVRSACVRMAHDAHVSGIAVADVYCLADRPKVHRWYESMGLKHAQDLPRYGVDGSDFVRYEAVTNHVF